MTDHDSALRQHVHDAVSLGCREVALGMVQMPPGYALLINPDDTHYFYLRWDGEESAIHWNKWAVYRWAREETKLRKETPWQIHGKNVNVGCAGSSSER
jgi:hypothetical protein